MTRPAKQQLLLLPPRASRLAVAARSCSAVSLQQDDLSSKRIVTFSADPPTAIPSYWQDYEEVQSLARQVWWTKAERALFGKTARTLARAYQGAAKMTPTTSSSSTSCTRRRPLLLHQRKVHRQLQDAIEDAQFDAHYQPKATSATITPLYLPWTVRGLEALICPILCRWRRQHVHGALALSSDGDSDESSVMAEWCIQSSRPSVLLAQRLAIADAGQTLLSLSSREDTQGYSGKEEESTTPCLPPRVVSPETIPPEEKVVLSPRPVGLFAPDGRRKRPRAGCSLLEHPQRRLLHKRRRLLWVR